MIKLDNIQVMNFEGALRGMRNPMASWNKSDSKEEITGYRGGFVSEHPNLCVAEKEFRIGQEDLKLAQKLVLSGSDHSKFMRQIFVTIDITAPLYWWKEMDTYKVATVANSESTMHRLAQTPITEENFSFDNSVGNTHDFSIFVEDNKAYKTKVLINNIINVCELLRQEYLKTKDPDTWKLLIQMLPESWNQMRTWTCSYATLRNIYFARRYHKLIEWRIFCAMIESLPYAKELICCEKPKKEFPVIVLCGSSKFKQQFLYYEKELTLQGNIVLSTNGVFGHQGDAIIFKNGTKEMLDRMYKQKIDMADEVFVINKDGYIGESTRNEIEYAKKQGKIINYCYEE